MVLWDPRPKTGKEKNGNQGENDLERSRDRDRQVVRCQRAEVGVAAERFRWQLKARIWSGFKSSTHLSLHALQISESRIEACGGQGGGDVLDERQEEFGGSWSKLKRWRLKRQVEERRAAERETRR